jgi:hypothetical protein
MSHATPYPKPLPLAAGTSGPVRYDASYEHSEGGEQQTTVELNETIRKIQTTVYQDSGRAMRGVHAKSHGLIFGQLRVLSGLPGALAQGLFATPATYPVVMRLSTIPGDVLDDAVSTPRGMAIKVIGVPGARVLGSEGDITQDFVLANGAAFAKPQVKSFLSGLKLLAKTTDKAQNLKKALSTVMRGAERVVEAFGGESPTLMTLGGYPETHLLGDTFYSQAALLYGEYMAKVSLAPVSPSLLALVKAPLDVGGRPDGLRQAVANFFKTQSAEWEVRVQLCLDPQIMPIEDASIEWAQDKSPYVAVARISAEPQSTWSAKRVAAVDEGMSFSPWHALASHRPLGAVMRVRRTVYEAAAQLRAERNGRIIKEPRSMAEVDR